MRLIDKDAVMAEIERRISNHYKELQHASDEDFVSSWASDEENQKLALTALIPFLNTLEIKEVDLEEEVDSYINENFSEGSDGGMISDSHRSIGGVKYCDLADIARHFFELGLNAKKGE